MSYKDLLKNRIADIKSAISVNEFNKARYNKLKAYLDKLDVQILKVSLEIQDLSTTLDGLKVYRIKKRTSDSNQISSTITLISNMVFPEKGYKYFIEGKLSRDNTYTELLFTNKQGSVLVPDISNGDGQKELASLGAIVSVIALSNIAPVLVTDEPLANLSPDRAPIAGEILEKFTQYGLQLIMIEHTKEVFDNIKYYQVDLENTSDETKVIWQGYIDNSIKEEQ